MGTQDPLLLTGNILLDRIGRRKPPLFAPSCGKAYGGLSPKSRPLAVLCRSDRIKTYKEQTVRKTYKYKLKPTPTQERVLGRVSGLCRRLYNTALEQRIVRLATARVSLSRISKKPN